MHHVRVELHFLRSQVRIVLLLLVQLLLLDRGFEPIFVLKCLPFDFLLACQALLVRMAALLAHLLLLCQLLLVTLQLQLHLVLSLPLRHLLLIRDSLTFLLLLDLSRLNLQFSIIKGSVSKIVIYKGHT